MTQTILVVEDEETLREELAYQLEQERFRVVQAADGAEALARFRSDKPDLIVLDVMLPVLSGIELTRIIRRESDVPILMLTARGSEVDSRRPRAWRRRLRDQAVQPARAAGAHSRPAPAW